MMSERIDLTPKNYYCHFCAMFDEAEVDATWVMWDSELEKAIPVCALHKDVVTKEKFYSLFSLN